MATAEMNVSPSQIFSIREALDPVDGSLVSASNLTVVEFADNHREVLDVMFQNGDKDVADFLKRAGLAHDHLVVAAKHHAQPKKEMTAEEVRAFNRGQLASTLRRNEAGDAADVIEGTSTLKVYEAREALSVALKEGKAERWQPVGWAIFYQLEAKENAEAEGQVLFFLGWLIRAFAALANSKKVSESDLLDAERALERSKPSDEWSTWALKALYRLISASAENPVNTLLRNDEVLRQKCTTPVAFVDYLREQIRLGIACQRETNVKAKAQQRTARRDRQLKRAEKSCKKHNKK